MRHLLVANLKMLVRDRQTLFWAMAFPLIFVAVFGLVDLDLSPSVDMVVVDEAKTELSRDLVARLEGLEFLDIQEGYSTKEKAREGLEKSEVGYVLVIPRGVGASSARVPTVDRGSLNLLYNDGNVAENQLVLPAVERLVGEVGLGPVQAPGLVTIEQEPVAVRQVAYFDRVLVGLVGMGLMVHSIIGIAVKISNYRNQRVLKRLLATPLPVRHYFASEVAAHLLLALVQTAVILAVGLWVFGADLRGEAWLIFPLAALGNIVFLNLGFIISGWASSGSAASGMGNAIALPLLFFSGTFFATSALPSVLSEVVQFLPLTPMLDAMREIAIDGTSLWDTWPELAILGGWIVGTSVVAVKVFRFS